jgi:hypothetical protein
MEDESQNELRATYKLGNKRETIESKFTLPKKFEFVCE